MLAVAVRWMVTGNVAPMTDWDVVLFITQAKYSIMRDKYQIVDRIIHDDIVLHMTAAKKVVLVISASASYHP